jgi:hybrid cluster-associated redox disulfide protein
MKGAAMRKLDFEDPDLPLSELFATWPQTAAAFMARRMLGPGCPIAPFHAITDACLEYGLDEDAFRAELAELIRK